jgi:cold shock protein
VKDAITLAELGTGPLMSDVEDDAPVLEGRVKWFDPVKGFGFVVAEGASRDILLHANVLRNFGQSSVADGTPITVRVQQTPRGIQAIEVIAIEAPQAVALPLPEEGALTTPEELAALPLEPARVKWFDKAKGFGFANVFGLAEDVFIHIEVLRVSGFADLQPGEAVCLRIIEGRRGRMAVQVSSWEAAARR